MDDCCYLYHNDILFLNATFATIIKKTLLLTNAIDENEKYFLCYHTIVLVFRRLNMLPTHTYSMSEELTILTLSDV